MVTIDIGNSYSKINGLDAKHFNKLREVLSYEVDPSAAFYSGRSFQRRRYCIDAKGVFATGLRMRVELFLADSSIAYCYGNLPAGPGAYVGHAGAKVANEPYAWQTAAVRFVEQKHRAIISAPTGSGKSLVIALVTARLGVRTLIVVPSLQIKEQLTQDLSERFGDMSNIRVENIDSGALKTLTGYDCLIIDEAHHVAAKTYHKLNKTAWKGIYYRVFLTATPFRNQTEETMLFEGIAGTAMYKLSYKEAVSKGYICPVEAYYINAPKRESDAYTWAQVYSQHVVNDEDKNGTIGLLLLNLAEANKPTLCLVKEISHGKRLSEMTGIPFANGQDEDSRQWIKAFNTGRLRSLIATEGICGEGVDTKPCEYVIIAGLGKAKSAFMQKVGRCVRRHGDKESGKVIIFRDASHKFLLRHFNEQKRILLEEYNVTVTKLE